MADDHSDSGMLALIPANPGALAIPGGIPTDKIHCTLVFLGDGVAGWSEQRATALREMAQALAANTRPIVARVFSNSVWNADRAPNPQGEPTEPALVYQLRQEGRELDMLQQAAAARAWDLLSVDFPTQWDPYLPHIAAAYGQDDASKLRTAPGEVRLATLRLVIGDDVHDFPLTGDSVALAHDGGEMTKTAEAAGTPEVTEDEDTGKLALHWPVLVVEGMRTGDGRMIPLGSLGHRGLPLPVSGQTVTDEGHKGAEVFGKITKLVRHDGPDVKSKETGEPFPEGTAVWEAWGEGDPEAKPAQLALDGYLTGNSADLADTTSIEELADEDGRTVVELRGGNIAGTTLVPVPAFADGYVEVNGERRETAPAVKAMVASAEASPAWRIIDETPVTAAGEPEDGDPFRPPLHLFQPRHLTGITPLTLEPQGDGTIAVYGHAADFNRPHISFTGQRVLARPSPSQYRKGFNTGALRVDDDGTERTVAVGRLTYGEGHADLSLDARAASAVYADPDKAWAWVQASDDAFGIQVNGVVIPGTPDERITKALAHPVSGDWRPMDGKLELVAACCVNTAGIPVPRQLVASGQVQALVAAGAVAPAVDNSTVVARGLTAEVITQLRAELPAVVRDILDGLRSEPDQELARRRDELAAEIGVTEFDPESLSDEDVAVLVERFGQDPDPVTFSHDGSEWMLGDALAHEVLANWVEKAGGLPSYVKRIVKHLRSKGDTESQAIATAFNVVKKMCATGDVNWPGKQSVNAGSRAQACKAAAWIKAHTGGGE